LNSIISARIQEAFTSRLLQKNKNEKRLYFILYAVLKDAISDLDIPENTNLPPTRQLAEALNLSRSTVLKAYDLLLLEGYTESQVGSGHRVKFQEKSPISLPLIKGKRYPELSKLGKSFLKNEKLINSTDDKSVAFRPGLPPLDIFPVNQWKNLTNLYWRHIKSSALTYSAASGNEQLKENIASYLNLSRGLKCESQQVIIVSGSLQSLYLAGSVLLNPKDAVVMEDPTFPNVLSIFKSLDAKIYGVPIDENGIQVTKIKATAPKLIHVTPSGHYPSGVEMSFDRKIDLLAYANKNNSYIIENDFEHEISNYKNASPSLFNLDNHGRTLFMGTFNRLLHPSIRLGYMVVPHPLFEPIQALMKHSHRFVPPSIQIVLNQFIEKKYLYTHIKNVATIAEKRKKLFIELFESYFSESLMLINKSASSLHLLAEFKQGKVNENIIKEFAKSNILVHSYSKCFIGKNKKEGLIFGYSSVSEMKMKRKMTQMERIYQEMKE